MQEADSLQHVPLEPPVALRVEVLCARVIFEPSFFDLNSLIPLQILSCEAICAGARNCLVIAKASHVGGSAVFDDGRPATREPNRSVLLESWTSAHVLLGVTHLRSPMIGRVSR